MLRDGILTSERVNALNWAEEVFYRRLMSVVDDFGRFYASPKLVRAACYPLHIDKVSDSDIGKWLTACVNAALVRVYPALDGKRYLELIDFKQTVRALKSKFPAFDGQVLSGCVADATQGQSTSEANAPVVVVGDVVVVGGEKGTPRKRGPSHKTPLPENFVVSDRVRSWAKEKGHAHLDAHLEAFIRKVRANGYRYVDWDEALMNCIADDWGKIAGRVQSSSDPDQWHSSKGGIEKKAAELGIHLADFPHFPAFRAAVYQAAGFVPSRAH